MAVAHDANTRFPSTNGTSGTNSVDTTTGTRTFTHTPVGTPKGVVVCVLSTATTLPLTEVWYGGFRMNLNTSQTETTEAGGVWVFTLAEVAVPTGAQTVSLFGCTSTGKWVTCSTVTAATTGTKVNTTTTTTSASGANPTLTFTTSAATLSYGALHTGADAPATAMGAGATLQHSNDYGTLSANTGRRTSEDASGSPAIQWTVAADDYAAAGVALQEFTLPAFVARPAMVDLQAVMSSATR